MGKLLIFSGEDEFTCKARARAAASELCRGEPDASDNMEVIEGDAGSVDLTTLSVRLADSICTPSMFADEQYIWVRDFGFFDALASEYKCKGEAGSLAGILAEPLPERLTLLISGPGLDQRKSWVKAVKAAGAVIDIASASKAGDRNFADNRKARIRDWCKAAGKTIEPGAVQYIEEISGSDPGVLYQEVAKVLSYIGAESGIRVADCRTICSRTPEAMGWNFTGALVTRNTREALTVLDTLLKQGDAEMRVLAMVSNEFQGMIKLKQAMKELNVTRVHPGTFDRIPEDVRAAHPDNMLLKLHPYRAFKMCENAARFTEYELAEALHSVLKTNRALVSGGGEKRMVLEQMIFEITGQAGTC